MAARQAGDSYRLLVKNKSGRDDMMCVFTELPVRGDGTELQKLAWLVTPSADGDVVEFQWKMDWGVFWKKDGNLHRSGVTFETFHQLPASPKDGCHFSLEVENDQFVKLVQKENLARNAIHIDVNNKISKRVHIGVTLAGKPCMAAQPIHRNFTYTATVHPTFFLCFGDYEPGGSVDISTHNEPFHLEFDSSGGGKNKLYVELNSQNKFVVVDGSQQDW